MGEQAAGLPRTGTPFPPGPRTSGRSESPAPPRSRTRPSRFCQPPALHAAPRRRRGRREQRQATGRSPHARAPDRATAIGARQPMAGARSLPIWFVDLTGSHWGHHTKDSARGIRIQDSIAWQSGATMLLGNFCRQDCSGTSATMAPARAADARGDQEEARSSAAIDALGGTG